MKTLTGRLVLFVVLAAGLALSACIFDTRDAADPSTSTGGGCTLDTPEKPFQCMSNALISQQDGDYERSISEAFVFSPTIADSLDQTFIGTGVYDNWTKDVEMDVLALLLSDAQNISVSFNLGAPLINQTTFVRFPVNYSLTVVNVATPTDTSTYRGEAQFDVRRENGIWRVTFWNEVATVEGYSTWGYLKGVLRLRL
jgi:hypothetical protein